MYSESDVAFATAKRHDLMQRLEETFHTAFPCENHPRVFTVEEANLHTGHLAGTRTKNLFLKSKKGQFFLLTARDDAAVRLNDVASRLKVSGGLRFADSSTLREVVCLLLWGDSAG